MKNRFLLKKAFLLFCAMMLGTSLWAIDITVQLKDSNGNALPDGGTAVLKYYQSGWKTATATGGGVFTISTTLTKVNLKMYYAGGSQQANDVSTDYTFNTVPVVVSLKSSKLNPLADGLVKYYASGWKTFGTTDGTGTVTKELLPIKYSFKMYYMGGSQQISNHDVGANLAVDFQTELVTVALMASSGAPLEGGKVKYYASGWKTFGTTSNYGIASKELLPIKYSFKMYYLGGYQQISNQDVNINPLVTFRTTLVTVSLISSTSNPLENGTVKYYASGWKTFGTTDASGTISKELLPIKYSFKMYYLGAYKQISNHHVGTNSSVDFQTTLVTVELKNCAGTGVAGGTVKYYASGWKTFGTTDVSGEVTKEMLPVNYSFKMYLNGAYKQISNQNVATNATVSYQTVTTTLVYAGTIKYYASGWKTFAQPTMEMLPGDYNFKFYTGSKVDFQRTISLTGCTYGGNVFAFKTQKADGSPLPNIKIYRNDYSNHYVTVGTTDADGFLYTLNMPDGSWKFKAYKDHTNQFITSAPSTLTFQTAKYTTHVKHTDGSDFEGIETEYNDYSNHWIDMSPKYTDASGKASIELFPGDYNFRAIKNHTVQTKSLELTSSGDTGVAEFQTAKYVAHVKHTDGSDFAGIETEYNDYSNHWIDLAPKNTGSDGKASIELFPGDYNFRAIKNHTVQAKSLELTSSGVTGTVEFKTSTYIAHVTMADGSDFAGIETEYNDYSNHWIDLSPKYTGTDGKASIELFAGDYNFRAKKNYSLQTGTLAIADEGLNGTIEFQTAKAVAFANDCDLNVPVAGIEVEYNDYSNHWIDLSPKYTDTDGKASIELFPGTFDLRAKTINTYEYKPIVLPASGSVVQVEFNPTRVCLSYDKVKYNDYSNHWRTITCDTYMFPGTYDFRFYTGNVLDLEETIDISGCAYEKAPIFVQLQNSLGNGLQNAEFKYRFGYGASTTIGTDATGDGIWYFIDGNPTNTKVRVSYRGTSVEKQQNIKNNPMFIFNTMLVTADLQESDDDDITAGATWNYRYGYDPYQEFDPAGEELLPVNTKVKVTYKGTSVEKQQHVGSASHFDFNTVLVTADLQQSDGVDITAGAAWKYCHGYDPSQAFNPAGEEILPVNTKVKVTYKGAAVEKQQHVGSASHFEFNTVLVTADLQQSDGVDITGIAAWNYRHGYDPSQAFNPAGEEILPVNTKVKVTYRGASVEKQQNVKSIAHFDFNTVKVTATLSNPEPGDDESDATWTFRYGYDPCAPFDYSGEELLPVNTKVKCVYNGASKEKQQNVKTASIFNFDWDGTSLKNSTTGDLSSDISVFETECKLYPVPAISELNVHITLNNDDIVFYKIFDLTGREVTSDKWSLVKGLNVLQLDVNNFLNGQYILFVKTGDEVITKKFSVKK